MRVSGSIFALAAAAQMLSAAEVPSSLKPADITRQSTHSQTKLIKVLEGKPSCRLNTFCLSRKGQIYAGCNAGVTKDGKGKGEILVLDATGRQLDSWKTPVNPEAINIAPDGSVLVAGDGRLFRYDAGGRKLLEAAAPHYKHLKGNADEVRKAVVQRLKQRAQIYDRSIKLYEQRVDLLKKKKEPTETDKRLLKAYESALIRMKQLKKQYANRPMPSKEEIDRQVAMMIRYKTGISSISSDGESVYVATRALVGYGFAIWRTDAKFQNAKQIVKGLAGCCGQMDVQCNTNGIYVAENSRHRVVRYDKTGKQLLTWGKRDRKGLTGFSSCCNPMNVCFGNKGDVYTAESTTGRIKRFDAKGKFLAYVGDVKLVPGCKKVSIAVSNDGKRVYMLDITRNHIVLMERKPAESETGDKKTASNK